MIERIKAIIEDKKVSPRQFAMEIGFNYSTLNNYLTGRRTTIDSLLPCAIISSYVDIDSSWLLTGKGSMYVADELPPITGYEELSVMDLHAALAKKTAECEDLQKENTKLLAQLEYMEGYNMRLQKKYLTLEKELSNKEKIKVV